jgi:hypothetical protein
MVERPLQDIMEPQDLTTLAALSALDMLEAEEDDWIDAHLGDSAEWLDQVQDFQAAAATLAYSTPLLPLSPTLKDRLFERIGAKVPEPMAKHVSEDSLLAELRARAETVEWKGYTPIPGAEVGVMQVDDESREVYCFVRSFGAVKFPVHRHAGEEEIIVLEGDLRISEKSYFPGDRIFSTMGTVHQPETDQGCLIYLKTSLDDELLNS